MSNILPDKPIVNADDPKHEKGPWVASRVLAPKYPSTPLAEKIVEFGAGEGRVSQNMARMVEGSKVTMVDVNPELKDLYERIENETDIATLLLPDVHHPTYNPDGTQYDFDTGLPGDSFDRVVMVMLIHHQPAAMVLRLFEEAARLLTAGGVVVFTAFTYVTGEDIFRTRGKKFAKVDTDHPACSPVFPKNPHAAMFFNEGWVTNQLEQAGFIKVSREWLQENPQERGPGSHYLYSAVRV